jgi:hypothetical protein
MSRGFLIAAVALLWMSSLAGAQPLPGQAEIQDLYAQGKYPQVLQGLNRLLALKGAAARAYDRHELLRIKGETHLRLKAAAPALQAFDAAAFETDDAVTAASDLATALLIKRSQQMAYQPRGKGKTKAPIPILEADARKQAILALFEDELAATEPRVRAARTAGRLPAIVEVIPSIRDLRVLELACFQKDARTRALVQDLGERARDLMAAGIKDLEPTLTAIETSANDVIPVEHATRDPRIPGGVRVEQRFKKRGIDKKEQLILQETYAACEKVARSCQDMAEAIGADLVDFGPVRADAGKLARRADTILRTDFSVLHATRPR